MMSRLLGAPAGRGEGIGHVGELLQGALRIDGRVEPFLVTLPAPGFRSAATACAARHWSVSPHWKRKALRAAQGACAHWAVRDPMAIAITSSIPVARGCGSSTADCVASVRAVADWLGVSPPQEEMAGIVQRAELACDSTMFDCEPIAFLPRAGRVLKRFETGWPALSVAAFDLGGPAVDTLHCPAPSYSEDELREFDWLLAQVENCMSDCAGLARVASRSAAIHQKHRPHPRWMAFHDAAMAGGALGVAIAHSGSMAAVLSQRPLAVPSLLQYELRGAREEVDHVHLAGRRR